MRIFRKKKQELQQAAVDFMGYNILFTLFDGDPDKWIQSLRERGSEEQLLHDLPFAFWVKHQIEKDPDLPNRVRQMLEGVKKEESEKEKNESNN